MHSRRYRVPTGTGSLPASKKNFRYCHAYDYES
ncbi:hypothetical protein HNQ10_000198 [Deinococcus metallilatus]|uniref:Uncharacterized protein n=1 Tax=Deinococcus metallilatus TaxID=1211322 RepID=A0ABR6MN68_9DEIO|nr:hypothetical protein [Deinococcus metallilatus]